MLALNWTCDFCHKRKKRCDGLAGRHCSFCASKNRAECHYSRRRPPSRTPATGNSRPASSPASARSQGHDNDDDDAVTGRSFWRTDLGTATALSGGGGIPAAATSGAGDGRVQGRLLPLKRGRFSASPATGLVGLKENEFLGDFFECLGFLALTNESTVREAMVRIMLAGGSPRNPRHHHHHRSGGTPSQFQPSPTRCQGKGADQQAPAFGEISTNVDGSRWGDALVVENRCRTLPRDASTCILWCAVALGALVRGHPLAQVGRYAELAEDSLRACRDDATLDTARAHVATAVLHDFLGHPVKTHEYLRTANSIVDQLPPEHIPRGFHGLLQYAGMNWTLETELASVEDVRGYWENAAPIWELSESVIEQDICGLVLSTSVRMNQHFVDVTGVNRVIFAEEPHPQPPASTAKPTASHPFIQNAGQQDAELTVGESPDLSCTEVAVVEVDQTNVSNIVLAEHQDAELTVGESSDLSSTEVATAEDQTNASNVIDAEPQDAELTVGESSDLSSTEVEVAEVDQINVSNVVASAEIPKSVLQEMLRVQEYFESSNTGVGGLLYYGGLMYLQALNNKDTTTAFMRSIDVMLRYPGLCRYKSWLWIAHSHLFMLAFTQQRCKYEEVRASYNSVRPPGSKAAPPFEEFRGIADICDHAFCRRSAERAHCAIRARLAQRPAP